jgi:hypothetical protein
VNMGCGDSSLGFFNSVLCSNGTIQKTPLESNRMVPNGLILSYSMSEFCRDHPAWSAPTRHVAHCVWTGDRSGHGMASQSESGDVTQDVRVETTRTGFGSAMETSAAGAVGNGDWRRNRLGDAGPKEGLIPRLGGGARRRGNVTGWRMADRLGDTH